MSSRADIVAVFEELEWIMDEVSKEEKERKK